MAILELFWNGNHKMCFKYRAVNGILNTRVPAGNGNATQVPVYNHEQLKIDHRKWLLD